MQTQELFGLPFVNADYEEVCNFIINFRNFYKPTLDKLPFVITPNVDHIIKFELDYPDLKNKLKKSVLILPDGQPIVWFSRLVGRPLKQRLAGSTLFVYLWPKINKRRCLLVLPSAETNKILKARESIPNVQTYIAPFFSLEENRKIHTITKECVNKIIKGRTDYVFIFLGMPKQEILAINIFEECQRLNIKSMPLFLLLGASIEFYLGIKKRAPVFLQKTGLEWLHRLLHEPRRLFKRYLRDLLFFRIALKEWYNIRRLNKSKRR